MRLHRAFPNDKRFRDLRVGSPRRNQAQDIEFAFGELGEWIDLILPQSLQLSDDA